MVQEVQMSIKMDTQLRDQFMEVASHHHRPAAQVIRELMRLYIANNQAPAAVSMGTPATSQSTQAQGAMLLEKVATLYMTDPAFSQCREDEDLWETTVSDGLGSHV